MLRYGWLRTGDCMYSDSNVFANSNKPKLKKVGALIEEAIRDSIEGLFIDIWRSKYLSTHDEDVGPIVGDFYNGELCSYDIIEEHKASTVEFPTSPQYDLEVIVAAVSIVKYLITSGAYIFDSDLLGRTPQQIL